MMALALVKQGLTEAAMFTAQGEPIQWAEVLYKKPVLVLRGSFRPMTRAALDVLRRGLEQFVAGSNCVRLAVVGGSTFASLSTNWFVTWCCRRTRPNCRSPH